MVSILLQKRIRSLFEDGRPKKKKKKIETGEVPVLEITMLGVAQGEGGAKATCQVFTIWAAEWMDCILGMRKKILGT